MHPLGHRVLGTKQSIADLTSGQMREYFQRRYSADNTVVALAGKLEFDDAVAQIEHLCGRWERTGATRTPGGPGAPEREFELRDQKVNRAYMLSAWDGPGATDDRRYAASLLAQVLGGPDNSRFHWALIETGMAENADAAFEPRDGCGDMFIYVCCDPERREEVFKVVEEQIAALSDSLRDEDLEKIRCKAATGVTVAGERPGGRMQRLGRQWTYQGLYTTLEEELARINRVGVADLRNVLRDFPTRPRTLGWLLPA
jgi:predicted Zn-dependent peptidase